MLHTETVAPKTLELLNKLMNDTTFNHFLLVGGTSLSLQLGHRLSVDQVMGLWRSKPLHTSKI
jgi:hypothetical protein